MSYENYFHNLTICENYCQSPFSSGHRLIWAFTQGETAGEKAGLDYQECSLKVSAPATRRVVRREEIQFYQLILDEVPGV